MFKRNTISIYYEFDKCNINLTTIMVYFAKLYCNNDKTCRFIYYIIKNYHNI